MTYRVRVTWSAHRGCWLALMRDGGDVVKLLAGEDQPAQAVDEAATYFGVPVDAVELVP